jgi:hypothetical protein
MRCACADPLEKHFSTVEFLYISELYTDTNIILYFTNTYNFQNSQK